MSLLADTGSQEPQISVCDEQGLRASKCGDGKRCTRAFRAALFAIIVCAAGVRISVALWLPSHSLSLDGRTYNRIASQIVDSGQYPIAEYKSAPLHPLTLAALYAITGPSRTAARLLMAFIGTVTCLLLYHLGKVLFDRTVGLIACGALAVYPLHVYVSGLYEYPQSLFIFLLCADLALLLWAAKPATSSLRAVLPGVVLGMAALAVPPILTAVPFLVLWLLLKGPGNLRGRALRAGTLGLGCVSVVFAWGLYWHSRAGYVMVGSRYGAKNLFKGNCRLMWETGDPDIEDVYSVKGVPAEHLAAFSSYRAIDERAKRLPPGPQRDKVYYSAVVEWYRECPGEAVALLGRKLLGFWRPTPRLVNQHDVDSTLTKIINAISFIPILVLAPVGVVLGWNRRRELMPILAVILTQWVTYAVYHVSVRYRSNIDVLLILLSSIVIAALGRKLRGRSGGMGAGAEHVDPSSVAALSTRVEVGQVPGPGSATALARE